MENVNRISITVRAGLAVLLLMACAGPLAAQGPTPDQLAFFEKEVRPLLADNCFKCHGDKKQENGLRLDARAFLMKGGDRGPALVPGEPDNSLLIHAVRYGGDPHPKMPPKTKLRDEQIAILVKWVQMGAPWPEDGKGAPALTTRSGGPSDAERKFWSFQPVPADVPVPMVKDAAWVKTPVDAFVLSALEAKGIKSNNPADKRTLIRRATFDLIGLPPTPAEVDAFLADTSPDAFAKVVERLLASPHYGERWGRHWLDVVRYADSAGETADYPVPEAYKYRNYVIDAFNADKPFDQFLREQIAGDILAQTAPREKYAEMVTATGYLAISRRFGFDVENYHHLTIADTIEVLGQSVLGLNLGCARCHDHKYDPVTANDYYALYGVFDSTRYPFAGSEQKQKVRTVAALVPPAEARAAAEAFERKWAGIEGELDRRKVGYPRVVLKLVDDLDGDFETQGHAHGGSRGVAVLPWLYRGEPPIVQQAQSPFRNVYPRKGAEGINFPADGKDHAIHQALRPARTPATHDVVHVNIDFRVLGSGEGSNRLLYLGHGDGKSAAVEVFASGSALFVRNGTAVDKVHEIKPEQWYNVQLAVDLDGRTYSGVCRSPVGDGTTFAARLIAPGWDGTIDHILIDTVGHAAGPRPQLEVDNVAVRDAPFAPLDAPPPPPTPPELTAAPNEEVQRQFTELVINGPSGMAYGVSEGTPGDARLQKRGEPTNLGDEVPRGFLAVLGGGVLTPEVAASSSGRFQLAEWLTRRANPLTARVFVNRIWQHHFGEGLVRTENDFGARGARPTHPQLLDWLADRFVDEGWSTKSMHRLIMLSSAYQAAGDFDARSADADPGNELLWRYPRRRLEAEIIRDAMLDLAGNLDRTVAAGGPHPFPQPDSWGYTQHGPFAATYDTNRRSVYLMNQRLRRHPFLALFDGPDPNASTAERVMTTVPTQALFMMNDPFVHAQSEGFARRLIAAEAEPSRRVALAYAMALGREPSAEETGKALAFLDQYRQQLAATGAPAEQHEAISWAAYARTVLCGNEFLFVE
jgi:mono/diheme cytochrome c family protein